MGEGVQGVDEPVQLARRCVGAMHAIADEAARVKAGEWPSHDNPLVNAPHTLAEVAADEWTHPYPRSAGGFPAGQDLGGISTGGRDKYWPPVARVDNVHGDKNVFCACIPVDAYKDEAAEA